MRLWRVLQGGCPTTRVPLDLSCPPKRHQRGFPIITSGRDTAGSKTQAHNGAVFWAPATSPSPRVHLQGRRKLFSKEAQDKQRLSPAPSWPHHGMHSAASSPPLGREAPGCMFSPQALVPHLLPTAPSLFSRRGINSDASRLNWKPSSSSERSELWLILMSKRCP